jgi:hypothetical protein
MVGYLRVARVGDDSAPTGKIRPVDTAERSGTFTNAQSRVAMRRTWKKNDRICTRLA